MSISARDLGISVLAAGVMTLFSSGSAIAQKKEQLVRMARLTIDSAQLENYKAALKVGIETALRLEPGVLALYAVAEKNNPCRITILEIYASQEAYQSHVKTAHFLKYKNSTKDMVTSLELVDVDPLLAGMHLRQ